MTQAITVFPGDFGGVETPPAAADGVVYLPVLNEPTTYQPEAFGFQGTIGTMDGEVVAIDVATGTRAMGREGAGRPAWAERR